MGAALTPTLSRKRERECSAQPASKVDGPHGAPRRIAILRALQLGDLLCAVPTLRALRRAWPHAEMTLIGLPWAAGFAERFAHLVDRFLEFPGFPGLPEREPDLVALPAFLATAQTMHFDVAIQLHGRGDLTNAIVAALGADLTAGFYACGAYCPDAARYAPWPEQGHEIERLLTLADFLGVPRAGMELEFPIAAAEARQAAGLLSAHGLRPGAYACVHPGARLRSRRWPAEYFADVSNALAAAGLRVVLTGSSDEAHLTAAVARRVRGAIDLAGRTSLGVLAALLRNARILICNDTGVSHVAAALRTPSVVVSCGADPARFAPLDRSRHEVVFHPVECRPCAHDDCPVGHPCANELTSATVVDRVAARLAAARGRAPRVGASASLR
jgi:ADP-heptose:LPS heptosyltransferase